MTDVTQILNAIEQGDPSAAEQLLPLVYDELRKLAAQKMSLENPGQTLQATALVHEAYLRLVGSETHRTYRDRSHFFASAATAMRRILVTARVRSGRKNGAVVVTRNRWKTWPPRYLMTSCSHSTRPSVS